MIDHSERSVAVIPLLVWVAASLMSACTTPRTQVVPTPSILPELRPSITPLPTAKPTLRSGRVSEPSESPPTATFIPTPVPAPTTNQFTAGTLMTRTWEAPVVLIQVSTRTEDVGELNVPPDLILYSDGQLVVSVQGQQRGRRLSRQEMCTLLYTVDDMGFFDFTFDTAALQRQLATLSPGVESYTKIEVNAWQSRVETVDATLWDPQFSLPLELRNTYTFLSHQMAARLQPFESGRLAVAIRKLSANFAQRPVRTWPLEYPSLKDLWEQGTVKARTEGIAVQMTGDPAHSAYVGIHNARIQGQPFLEDGILYSVQARWLLPYESLESAVEAFFKIPSPGVVAPASQLTCYPSDVAVQGH